MNIAGIRLRWGLEAPSLQVGRSWRDVKLSAGKILITGVASHPTGLVAHPELVARHNQYRSN